MQKLKFKLILLALFTLVTLTNTYSDASEECFEKTSRAIFKFNLGFDEMVLEPIAKGYSKLPKPVKSGASNFTSNIGTLLSIPNNILQGNFKELGQSIGSFALNTSVGVLGLFNPAERIGLKPHKEDVGQTLGLYGFGPGCYFVLPILGPTTVRDSLGILADSYLDPFAHVTIREKELLSSSGNSLDYYSIKGVTAVNFRSENDKSFESLEKNSIDLYSSVKSVYLQSRENKIKNSADNQDEWTDLDN